MLVLICKHSLTTVGILLQTLPLSLSRPHAICQQETFRFPLTAASDWRILYSPQCVCFSSVWWARHFSGTLSPPAQLNALPLLLHNSRTRVCLHAPFPSSALAQMDGQRKQPMNQSEGCGREGGRDISSMLVAGAQAA